MTALLRPIVHRPSATGVLAAAFVATVLAIPTVTPAAAQRLDGKSGREETKRLPLRPGVWGVSVYEGARIVYGPAQSNICSTSDTGVITPPIFPAQHFGKVVLEEIFVFERVWRLEDGRYESTGRAKTTRGGPVQYRHHIKLLGDDQYEDELTVTSHATTHPLKHFYKGSGRWLAPCANPVR